MAPPPPDEGALRLVVLGDSTAFTDDRGPQLPSEPGLYPNVLARGLEAQLHRRVEVTVLARAGMTVREAFRTVTKDRHAQFDVLAGADAIVVAIGGIDHAPAGVPEAVEAVLPYLRPAPVRRRVRRGLRRAHPWLVRATRWRLRRTAASEFRRLFDRLLLVVRGLGDGAAMVVVGPTSHRSDYYAWRHPLHPVAEAEQFAIAARHGIPTVACWPLVEPALDRLNPDGIHWPGDVHAAVAAAIAEVLVPQLDGSAPRPPRLSVGQTPPVPPSAPAERRPEGTP